MSLDWSPLRQELALLRQSGTALPLWWRDDDAVAPTPALDRLLDAGDALNVPVHLAVIPSKAIPSLSAHVAGRDAVALVHGWTHDNHAPVGAKKAEFGHPRDGSDDETAKALERMQSLFGDQLLAMFVPPWNRIDDSVVRELAGQGYAALSTFTPRAGRLNSSLVQINTHIDPIHWRGGGGLADPEGLISLVVQNLSARRRGETDATEPLGFLTHHLVHDDNLWEFTHACLSELLDGGAAPCNLLTQKDTLP